MFTPRSLYIATLVGFAHLITALPTNLNSTRNVQSRQSSYQLRDSYTATNFFSSFDFFDAPDPTHGFVSYQPQDSAWSRGLINTNDNQIHMGVDHTTVNPPSPGRASVRLTSKKAYNHGLFIADIPHMPASQCGSWPAFWMFGPSWPNSGEIDIIENVHLASTNAVTLHTSSGCYINTWGSRSDTRLHNDNCNHNSAYEGCSTETQTPFGDAFNAAGGGIYAMQWESSGIYVWFFPRDAIPADISNERPDTWNWGPPVVTFNGGSGCNIDSYFKDQNIVFDTTFCGDWAGSTWGSSTCASKAPTCEAYVAENPEAFSNSFWKVNSVKVYQQG